MEKQFHSPNTSQPDSSGSQIDLEQLLKDGNIIRIHPQGYSMYPLFLPGRDEALIESVCADDCKKKRCGSVSPGFRYFSASPDLPHYRRWFLSGGRQPAGSGGTAASVSDHRKAGGFCPRRKRNLRPPAVLPFSFFPVALSSAGAPALFPPVGFFSHHSAFMKCPFYNAFL